MARKSLKPQLNQIRTWVRQGRTDAWIAHQLEVSVSDIRGFKREHELAPAEPGDDGEPFGAAGDDEDVDLRAEDDALVAAALEAEQAEEDEEEQEEEEAAEGAEEEGDEEEGEGEAQPRRRRRGRRGGRGRRRRSEPAPLEGTFDHGEEGYGLWLDPAVQDDPLYAEHWAGHRPVTVVIEAEQIVITRAGEDEAGEGDAPEDDAPAADEGD